MDLNTLIDLGYRGGASPYLLKILRILRGPSAADYQMEQEALRNPGAFHFVIDPASGRRRLQHKPKAELPRCGARTRRGAACRMLPIPMMARCRFHGGLSTGPKTAEGRARIAESNRRRAARKRAAVAAGLEQVGTRSTVGEMAGKD